MFVLSYQLADRYVDLSTFSNAEAHREIQLQDVDILLDMQVRYIDTPIT